MKDVTPLSPDQLAWLRHAAALGQAEPQALLYLLGRVEALEAVAAGGQPDKLDRLIALDRDEDEAGAAPSKPATLAQQLAELIADFASVGQPGDSATPTAIQVVRLVAGWLRRGEGPRGARFGSSEDLSEEADRAAAELKGRSDG